MININEIDVDATVKRLVKHGFATVYRNPTITLLRDEDNKIGLHLNGVFSTQNLVDINVVVYKVKKSLEK